MALRHTADMKRLVVVAATFLICAPVVAAEPVAAEPVAPEPTRQLRGCMIKRMTADRLISYNDAKKACLAQLVARSDSGVNGASKRLAQPPGTRATTGTVD